jgi:hypothetical protein
MILSEVAASFGSTISGTPLCHCPTRNSPSGWPRSSQLSGPRIVSTLLSRSQSASLICSLRSIVPTAFTAAWRTCAVA